jgi:hypothetical protein
LGSSDSCFSFFFSSFYSSFCSSFFSYGFFGFFSLDYALSSFTSVGYPFNTTLSFKGSTFYKSDFMIGGGRAFALTYFFSVDPHPKHTFCPFLDLIIGA